MLEVDIIIMVDMVTVAVTEVEVDTIATKTNDNLVIHKRRPKANHPHAPTDRVIRTRRGSNESKVSILNFIQVFIWLISLLQRNCVATSDANAIALLELGDNTPGDIYDNNLYEKL